MNSYLHVVSTLCRVHEFWYLPVHPAHTLRVYAYPPTRRPTWRGCRRVPLKGPVGKRLTTICSEHVSGRPLGNKSPLRLWSLSLSLYLVEPLDRSSSPTVYGQGDQREKCLLLSLPFSFSSPFSLFLLTRRSGLCFLRGTRLRSPAASCLPLLFLPPLPDPRIIVFSRLTVPCDPVNSTLQIFQIDHCVFWWRSFIIFLIFIIRAE